MLYSLQGFGPASLGNIRDSGRSQTEQADTRDQSNVTNSASARPTDVPPEALQAPVNFTSICSTSNSPSCFWGTLFIQHVVNMLTFSCIISDGRALFICFCTSSPLISTLISLFFFMQVIPDSLTTLTQYLSHLTAEFRANGKSPFLFFYIHSPPTGGVGWVGG